MDKEKLKMISENYALSKDRVQWILTELYKAKDKNDNEVIRTRNSYHSTLRQVANYLINNGEHHSLDSYICKAEQISCEIDAALDSMIYA